MWGKPHFLSQMTCIEQMRSVSLLKIFLIEQMYWKSLKRMKSSVWLLVDGRKKCCDLCAAIKKRNGAWYWEPLLWCHHSYQPLLFTSPCTTVQTSPFHTNTCTTLFSVQPLFAIQCHHPSPFLLPIYYLQTYKTEFYMVHIFLGSAKCTRQNVNSKIDSIDNENKDILETVILPQCCQRRVRKRRSLTVIGKEHIET